MIALVILLFVSLIYSQNPNECAQYPTCEECLKHNLCGWCAVNVKYEDGSDGPHCAGKPKDPLNPPPGFKKWTCPLDYQNLACYGYICDPITLQCKSSGTPNGGIPLADCLATCIGQTYVCNTTIAKCEPAEPGTGEPLSDCQKNCETSGFACDPSDQTCKPVDHGGLPKEACLESCKPANVTPPFMIGDYRGLEISQGYMKGEWRATFDKTMGIIFDPSGNVWAKGAIQTIESQLWIQTNKGTKKGIFALTLLPEVSVLTWALGKSNGSAPASFEDAMMDNNVLVLAKCLNPSVCQWKPISQLLKVPELEALLSRSTKRVLARDPCANYTDCQSCVDALYDCGWCSVPVVYPDNTVGANCATVNTTIGPKFNCSGFFSIEDCSLQTTDSSGTAHSSTSTGTGSGTGTGTGTGTGSSTTDSSTGSTGGSSSYSCEPQSQKCTPTRDGPFRDKPTCDNECITIPIIPPNLQNRYFRGLEIDKDYLVGEWRLKFGKVNDVTISDPSGTIMTGVVSIVSKYLQISLPNGQVISTLWQVNSGPASDFLSWAWGEIAGPPPTDFDSAMVTKGQKEFMFVACPLKSFSTVCDFSKN